MLIYIIRGVPIYNVEEYAHKHNQGCAYLHCGVICSYILSQCGGICSYK